MSKNIQYFVPLDIKEGLVEMKHGSGGLATAHLVEHIFHRHFKNEILSRADDFALLSLNVGQCAMSTDTFVVSPLFFPGGDIGSLSIHGTVNDLAMSGLKPSYLSAGFILEEGFPLIQLDKIVESMALAAKEAGVQIITGDTKVVERGKADGIFINTAGIALPYENSSSPINSNNPTKGFSGNAAEVGDAILISGTIGDHGVAIMAQREGLEFETTIESDSAPLNHMIKAMMDTGAEIHCLRDPTRGGLASTLNEIAAQSQVGMCIDEASIPMQREVYGACELLGLDPLYVANEGKLVCICKPEAAAELLAVLRKTRYGKNAAVIGEVTRDTAGQVLMKTKLGGHRLVDSLEGEQLPRIC